MAHPLAAHMLAGAPQELCAHAGDKLIEALIDRDKFAPPLRSGRGTRKRLAHPRASPEICTLTMRTARLSSQSAQQVHMMAGIG